MRQVLRPPNPIVRTAFPMVVFFLAAIFSGLLDKMYVLLFLHILTVVGGLTLILIAVGGRIQVLLKSPIAQALIAFTIWLMICIPFARWRGGSFTLLENIWSRSALAFFLVAGGVVTIAQSKTIFKTIGYSVGVLAIMALALRYHDSNGRLALVNTRYENANDFAWTLLLGLSFLSFLLLQGKRREKLMALFLSAPILLALMKTGSRAGMIGLIMLFLFSVFQASRAVRRKLALGLPILVVLLVAVTPGELRSRFTTLSNAGPNATRLEAQAVGSTEARIQLLKDSIYLTLVHPLFGVGPGDFPVAQNDLALARGDLRGIWGVTHNTYTQISSEMGIPGLIIYLVFLYQCFKPLNSIIRSRYPGKDWHDLRALARSLRASLVVMLTIAVFDAYGYDVNIPIMAGLCCALALIAQRQRALLTTSQQIAAPAVLAPEPALEARWMSFQ